jgi:hypothetical protein
MLIVPETVLLIGLAAELAHDSDALPQPTTTAASITTAATEAGRPTLLLTFTRTCEPPFLHIVADAPAGVWIEEVRGARVADMKRRHSKTTYDAQAVE